MMAGFELNARTLVGTNYYKYSCFFFIQVVFQTYNKEHQARVGIDDLLIIGANNTGKIYMETFKDHSEYI